ncbi:MULTISPECIES: metallophosphoesterase [unclassified Streptomyces]|uniref:metallophosphoesterase n=1 Tax=unclassified Streptomyces TaxID=2593676 RepID=UPI0029B614AB|nr:metallophosphoesterase [Streptomyces sp. FL07-04A]MDX3578418.1 metallophosphoesterase [Streptomyces sp. FL07-04A]
MVIVFAVVALTVLVTANWYLWRRLFRDTTRGPGRARRGGAVLIAGGWALAFGALAAERAGAPFWLQRILAWPGFLWLALSVYLLLGVVAGEAVRPLLRRFLEKRARAADPSGTSVGDPVPDPVPVGAPASERSAPETKPGPGAPGPGSPAAGAPSPSRRVFVSRVVAGAAAAAAAGTVGYGTYGVLRGPRVKRVTVPLAKLPRAAHGYRIAVVSDIHLGPVLGRGFAQKVVDTINATQPDLIAVVGDLVDGSVKDLGPAAAPLSQLRARHGSYFVTGNHEYFSGAAGWVEEVRRLGLTPLENARTELDRFDLAGVNDIAGESEGQGPDFTRALGGRDTARACVLLAHQPVQIHDAMRHGVDLQLSGHTHGGQLWPGNFVAAAANPTLAGLERHGDTQLYVSRGAGAWGPPTRVGAPSDITVVELASRHA